MVKIMKIEPLNRSFAQRTYDPGGCEQCDMLACVTLAGINQNFKNILRTFLRLRVD